MVPPPVLKKIELNDDLSSLERTLDDLKNSEPPIDRIYFPHLFRLDRIEGNEEELGNILREHFRQNPHGMVTRDGRFINASLDKYLKTN